MREVVECVICASSELKSRKAVVAPFVAHQIWGRQSFTVELLECASCGFAFFSPRLEKDEEQRLYANYRSEAYQQTRYSFEPWYTKGFNDSLFCDPTMRGRREVLKGILAPHLAKVRVQSILDFGGGRGELISDLVPGADRYVYDPSGTEPLSGIQGLEMLAECRAHRYDLIVCSNVLEHVAYPRDVLRQITDIASPDTLILVEVPHEVPFGYRERWRRLLGYLLLLALRPRIALGVVGRGMLYVMHEHVNFFSPAALQRLMSSMSLEIWARGSYEGKDAMNYRMLWSLGWKKA